MRIKAPAKINIGLNVVSKREDGYHNLETVFYPISLHDEIIIEKSAELKFRSSNSILEQDENNLILKTFRLMGEITGRTFESDIYLQKDIPIGAGLGGGSSDAAAVLIYLNEQYDLHIPPGELNKIALSLGSDVPFFLNPLPSFARLRGDDLEVINFTIPYPILIVNPGIHISTAMAFSKIIPSEPIHDLKNILLSTPDYRLLKEKVINDFEAVVFELYPEIAEIKSRMYYSGSMFSLMTGTGSTVFGIYPDLMSARSAENIFRENYYTYIEIPV